jgi:YkoY family integral membrane protein
MIDLPFGQTFAPEDLAIIGILCVLEIVLSFDNALVLGVLAQRLPPFQRRKALTYGLAGALAFRLAAVAAAQYVMQWSFFKVVGGAYLIYLGARHFVGETGTAVPAKLPSPPAAVRPTGCDTSRREARFWPTVGAIELTDVAFAVDSVLAAIALVRGPDKLWLVVMGGMLGVLAMRCAAYSLIALLERFPRFEVSAYLLVSVIGVKLFVEWLRELNPDWQRQLDFHDASGPAFWVFWLSIVASLAVGLVPRRIHASSTADADGR